MQKELILSGVFQALSIYSTIMMSIKVDYLFNVLLRSSKFLTILIGTLIFKTHAHNVSKKDIFWGAVLTLGVIVFSLGQESKSKHGVHISGYLYGIFSLICDAFVSHYQESIKAIRKSNHAKALSFNDFTLGTNIYMLVSTLIISLVTKEFSKIGLFFHKHPKVILDIFEQQFLLIIGVYTMFYFVHQYGSI